MATNVIHGTGKPRILVNTNIIHTDSISAVSGDSPSYSVTLAVGGNLAGLAATYGLINYILWTKNGDGEVTWGRIIGYSETPNDVLTILDWSNGEADPGADCYIQNVVLDLPYCFRLTEMWMPDFIVHKLYNGNIYRRKRGFYYSASLDYSNYIHKDNLEIFRQLLRTDRNDIWFYPRRDNLNVSYKVDISPDSEVVLNQIQHHLGHRSWVINLIGVERLPEVQIYDPEESSGYGEDYGSSYGIGL